MRVETTTDTQHEPLPESVVAIRKHAAWLVRDGLLTQGGAAAVQRALEQAIAESRRDLVAVAALVDGLLQVLADGVLSPDLFVVDEARGIARFHLAPVLSVLVEARLLTGATDARLRRLLPVIEAWFPDAGLSGVRQRFTFSRRDRRRGLELDLAKGRAFLKRTEAVPSR